MAIVESKRLMRLAERQGGLFTRRQALDCGYSSYQIRRRLAAREWRGVAGQVFVLAGLAVTAAHRDRAAQLSVDGSVLAGPSAARVWGLPVPDLTPTLWVAGPRHPRLAGVRFLRWALPRSDVTRFEGADITTRERTVVDCLRLLDEVSAAELLDHALQLEWITVSELSARSRDLVGRKGAPRLVRAMSRAASGGHSDAERRLHALLRSAGIRGWRANVPIDGQLGLTAVGDVVFRAARLVVEIDGYAYHTSPERFRADRHRQNRLVAHGWTVLRFTWRDLRERPDYVVATIMTTLARLGAASAKAA